MGRPYPNRVSKTQRIMVVGPAGSGKSTLTRDLGALLNLPVIHLDTLYWRPGWVEPPFDEFAEQVAAAAAGDRWVIDGNYSRAFAPRFARADLVVFLDFPRRTSLWRVTKRRVANHGKTRPDMAPGCPEKIDIAFYRFIWEWPRRRPALVAELREVQARGLRVVVIRRPVQVRAFLRQIAAEAQET